MAWLAVTLKVPPAQADVLVDALLESGAVSVDIADAFAGTPRECAQFNEPGEPASPQWELALVSALFDDRADVPALLPPAPSALPLLPYPAKLPEYQVVMSPAKVVTV